MKGYTQRDVVDKMIHIYCHAHHHPTRGTLCPECQELLDYASRRLKKCPIEEHKKSSCRLCKIHCYDHSHAERVRQVMRYAGPRMLLHNPIMAICHLLKELKK